jgi:hypothetical protein
MQTESLREKVASVIEEDMKLGYDIWRSDPLSTAKSFIGDYPDEFKNYSLSDIENAIRTWRRENAHRYYEDAS